MWDQGVAADCSRLGGAAPHVTGRRVDHVDHVTGKVDEDLLAPHCEAWKGGSAAASVGPGPSTPGNGCRTRFRQNPRDGRRGILPTAPFASPPGVATWRRSPPGPEQDDPRLTLWTRPETAEVQGCRRPDLVAGARLTRLSARVGSRSRRCPCRARALRQVTAVSAPDAQGHPAWELADGATLADVRHLACRSARFRPDSAGADCSPDMARGLISRSVREQACLRSALAPSRIIRCCSWWEWRGAERRIAVLGGMDGRLVLYLVEVPPRFSRSFRKLQSETFEGFVTISSKKSF